jgi:hypothetical protein
MNRMQWIGQVMLWSGFLIASLVTVSRKEIDLLPSSEQVILQSLNDNLRIPKSELARLTEKPISSMNQRELGEWVGRLNAWHEENQNAVPAPVNPQRKIDILARRTAALDNLWSTINWSWYSLALLGGFIGVLIFRAASTAHIRSVKPELDGYHGLVNTLAQLFDKVGNLKKQFDNMIPEEVLEYIDEHCVLRFTEFADARHSLTERFGLTGFAEIMSDFALSERSMNRAWCASADGYLDEARDSIARSYKYLQSAREKMRTWETLTDKSSDAGFQSPG